MLIVFYILLVWLKIISCTTIAFLWLWIARDRGARGLRMAIHIIGALAVWIAPWAVFLWSRVDLYKGKCGLRLGVHDCAMVEFLWNELQWFRLGLLLDVLLLIGVFFVIFRSRVATDNGAAIGAR